MKIRVFSKNCVVETFEGENLYASQKGYFLEVFETSIKEEKPTWFKSGIITHNAKILAKIKLNDILIVKYIY